MVYKAHAERLHRHLKASTKRQIVLYGVAAVVVVHVIVQLLLPWNNLPLFATIDGMAVGGKDIQVVTKELNEKYAKLPVGLYFGNNTKAYRQPFPSDIGVTVDTKQQVEAAQYALWMRLIPTSVWWAHLVTGDKAPTYTHDKEKAIAYVKKELGNSCDVKPQNATLTYKDKELQVVPATDGGTCELSDVEKLLTTAEPDLKSHAIRIPMKERAAKLRDNAAKEFADELLKRTESISIKAGNENVKVPQGTFLAWLDFAAPDTGITAKVNVDRANCFFSKKLAPKVAKQAGTSRVTTLDFDVVSSSDGVTGRALDTNAMAELLNKWIEGEDVELVAQVRDVSPQVVYTRKYTATDKGLSALISQFAKSHGGSFGVSLVELDGKKRRAAYQDTKAFRTASTYKLFVAYGTLKRVEKGQWRWTDRVHGGRDLAKCFDDMIVLSDNPCAETLLEKIGYTTLTNELRAIGLTGSNFTCSCGFPVTTARDLTTFIGALFNGQLFKKSESTNRLISAMKRNVYRQGIPAGAKGQVADKVGFLNAFLHDAALVYSPSGTYALTILTEHSSWATIAELTREIEKLRTQ